MSKEDITLVIRHLNSALLYLNDTIRTEDNQMTNSHTATERWTMRKAKNKLNEAMRYLDEGTN
jgi:hypothetical protein